MSPETSFNACRRRLFVVTSWLQDFLLKWEVRTDIGDMDKNSVQSVSEVLVCLQESEKGIKVATL